MVLKTNKRREKTAQIESQKEAIKEEKYEMHSSVPYNNAAFEACGDTLLFCLLITSTLNLRLNSHKLNWISNIEQRLQQHNCMYPRLQFSNFKTNAKESRKSTSNICLTLVAESLKFSTSPYFFISRSRNSTAPFCFKNLMLPKITSLISWTLRK